MTLLNAFDRFHKYKLFWFSVILSYLFIAILTTILYQTFVNHPLPITNIENEIVTIRKGETVEVVMKRKFSIEKSAYAIVYREVINLDTKQSYEFPGNYKTFRKGDYDSVRSFMLPSSAPSGRYVFKTTVVWNPLLSLVDHYTDLPDISFKVCDTKHIECKSGA